MRTIGRGPLNADCREPGFHPDQVVEALNDSHPLLDGRAVVGSPIRSQYGGLETRTRRMKRNAAGYRVRLRQGSCLLAGLADRR